VYAIWRCHVDAADREKAERVTARLRERLGVPLDQDVVAPSRAGDRGFDVRFRTRLRSAPAETVFDVLAQAATLSRALVTAGPVVEPSGALTFDLVAAEDFTVPGLTWLHVQVQDGSDRR
jgi:hypothetical protein